MEITAVAQWLNTAFASFDESVTAAVHGLYEAAGGFMSPFMEFISFLGDGGVVLIIVSIFLMLFRKTRRYGLAMLLAISIGALLTNLWLKPAITRPRPYVDENGFFYQLWVTMGQHLESDKSFPSGHTTAAFSAMTALFWVGKKRISWTAFLFAITMGISRIYLVVHYPSDVLGGIVVGLFAGSVAALVAVKLPKATYEYDLRNLLKSQKAE